MYLKHQRERLLNTSALANKFFYIQNFIARRRFKEIFMPLLYYVTPTKKKAVFFFHGRDFPFWFILKKKKEALYSRVARCLYEQRSNYNGLEA